MAKTSFEKFDAGTPGTAGFKVSGALGFHENAKVEQLAAECLKRKFRRVIFDFSDLESLGGGVARILRGFVVKMNELGGKVVFVINSDVILEFLRDGETPIITCPTVEEAAQQTLAEPGAVGGGPGVTASGDDAAVDKDGTIGVIHMSYDLGAAPEAGPGQAAPQGAQAPVLGNFIEPRPIDFGPAQNPAGDDEAAAADEVQGDLAGASPGGLDAQGKAGRDGAGCGADGGTDPVIFDAIEDDEIEAAERARSGNEAIISEIFGGSKEEPGESRAGGAVPKARGGGDKEAPQAGDLNRKLKRRILELRTLFSISSDFNAIRDRKKLLDIFLLTSIAQGGVESAVFLEKNGQLYEPIMSKGVDSATLQPINLTPAEEEGIRGSAEVTEIDRVPLAGETRDALKSVGLVYLCPFHRGEGPASLVMLGKRIAGRGMQKEDFEFMQVLVNLARGAYRNALLFEREHERTLGIVKTLISLIEENTLLKGTSEFVSRYVGMVAKDMDYPDERFTDLIYGTVLRDMGMIKVSDLIVRSPRELNKDEWQVIKRHPEDGAEMLRRMKFSDHVVEIVLGHHERFNGEGYPRGLRGRDIPIGARIISVVESYAAMIHERPNRPALSEREALDTLRENYGLRYDRDIVNHFYSIMEKEIAKSVNPVTAVV